jgi:hypothetical protein
VRLTGPLTRVGAATPGSVVGEGVGAGVALGGKLGVAVGWDTVGTGVEVAVGVGVKLSASGAVVGWGVGGTYPKTNPQVVIAPATMSANVTPTTVSKRTGKRR